jgi:hypothetical protein
MEGFKVNYSDVYGDTCAKCLVWGAQCGFDSKPGEPGPFGFVAIRRVPRQVFDLFFSTKIAVLILVG